MSQTVDVNMEPLKWPIAPDGYIPNSVIRNWRKKRKDLNKVYCWDDISYSSHRVNQPTAKDEEHVSTRVLWITQDEEEEEEETDDVKWRMEDEKNEKAKKEKTKVQEKERADEKKAKEVHKMERYVLLTQMNTNTTLQNQLKLSDDGQTNVKPQTQEVGSTFITRKTVNVLEQTELTKLHETIKPHVQLATERYSLSDKQRTSSLIPKEWPEPPLESTVVSVDVVIPKQEPRTLYVPPIEVENRTPYPLKVPPSTPEDPQPQRDRGPPECSPIKREIQRGKGFLLSSTKYNNIRDQLQVTMDKKVLELFKKLKVATKNSSRLGKRSTIAKHPATSKAMQARKGFCPPDSKTTHTLQDFCSPWAAKCAAGEHPVKSSNASQHVATIPTTGHQRVVQKIQMKDTLEPATFHFHHVIPMASQQSFFTLNPHGTTQYGRLQFYWIRRHDADNLLSVCNYRPTTPLI
ncbi:uncharacterized protein LOC116685417 isoform X2 [Etheostoma spectabile]|uniref:uncharacterized protein LOC116685417 isoform X2 n=1 Tax=Etheostoma spectabile TaxID=54343 RepID=UPI0013AF11F9|nr:uncharacterized protein LOC116685417 isoform X2 [Etheostoma spectabile]